MRLTASNALLKQACDARSALNSIKNFSALQIASDMFVVPIINDFSLLAMLLLESDSHFMRIVEWLTVQLTSWAEVMGGAP